MYANNLCMLPLLFNIQEQRDEAIRVKDQWSMCFIYIAAIFYTYRSLYNQDSSRCFSHIRLQLNKPRPQPNNTQSQILLEKMIL